VSAPAVYWRGLSGPFTCTDCGGGVVHDNEAMQTADGTRKQCGGCVQARLDVHWAGKPSGVYGTAVSDAATGEVLGDPMYVRHTRPGPITARDLLTLPDTGRGVRFVLAARASTVEIRRAQSDAWRNWALWGIRPESEYPVRVWLQVRGPLAGADPRT